MDLIKRLEPVAMLLMLIGCLNLGIVGLFETNLLVELLGSGMLIDITYVLIGLAALLHVPSVLEMLHIGGGHHPRPHGT